MRRRLIIISASVVVVTAAAAVTAYVAVGSSFTATQLQVVNEAGGSAGVVTQNVPQGTPLCT